MDCSLNTSSLLQEHSELIKRMAYKAFGKIRKPSAYDLDDLIQEGYAACIKALNNWDESKGTKLSTWIQFILERHYCDIVWYSYRKITTTVLEDLSPFQHLVTPFEEFIDLLDLVENRFTRLERKYIRLCLEERIKDINGFRERVRVQLNINEKDEDYLRNSIRFLFLEER